MMALSRFLLQKLGADKVGLWALVLSTTSVAKMSQLGLSGSTLRFISMHLARGDDKAVSETAETAVLSVALFTLPMGIAGYALFKIMLPVLVEDVYLKEATALLPFCLFSFILSSTASVPIAIIEGYQRFDMKVKLQIACQTLYLIISFLTVERFGLQGLGYAQIIQSTVLLFTSWILGRNLAPNLPLIPRHWKFTRLKEIMVYGVNFQVIGVLNIVNGPLIRGLLTFYGSLEITGYYEIADRLIRQVKNVMDNASRVLIPVFADVVENHAELFRGLYRKSYSLLFSLVLISYTTLIVFFKPFAQVWLGEYDGVFATFTYLLILGYGINNLCVPAYVAFAGSGEMHWNTLGHVVMAILTVALGSVLGIIWGGTGVVIGYVMALAGGSLLILILFHRLKNISFASLLPMRGRMIAFSLMLAPFALLIIENSAIGNGVVAYCIYGVQIILVATFFFASRLSEAIPGIPRKARNVLKVNK